MTKLDGKFHGVVVKNKNQSIVPQDQWMVFLAKDNAVPHMLQEYYRKSVELGASNEQLSAVYEMMERVNDWRKHNPHLLKVADVEVGEIIT